MMDMQHEEKRFDPRRKGYLLGPERESHWNPPEFLRRLSLQEGQTVADLGSGPGFWTFPLAAIVGPHGRVWALDGSRELLDDLNVRNPPPQVQVVQSELPHIALPDRSVDLIWAAFVVHEVDPLEQFVSEMRRTLGPAGRIAILDWRPDAIGEAGPPRNHRLSSEMVLAVLTAGGFPEVSLTWRDEDTYLVEAQSGILRQ
jgi:ubiquinone/menaquinone biosynthesis C-methylase UbiE